MVLASTSQMSRFGHQQSSNRKQSLHQIINDIGLYICGVPVRLLFIWCHIILISCVQQGDPSNATECLQGKRLS